MAIIGLDVGSTGCKAIVFDSSGKSLAHAHIEYPFFEKVYEIDGNTIWDCVATVLKHCGENSPEKITALCISSFGESFVPIDSQGNVLLNTMLYTDKRGRSQCDWLEGKIGRTRLMQITGHNPQPMYSLPKILYIRDNYPEIYSKVYKFLMIGPFCAFRLTGNDYIDYSLASRTLAFDVIKKEWSQLILKATGIDESLLSNPVPSGTIVGQILPEAAKKLALPEGITVVSGGQDQICAALGAGVVESDIAVDGMGTVECITPIFKKPQMSSDFLENNYACVPYVFDGTYATYAFTFSGGSILKWYRNTFASDKSYKELDQEGSKNPTDLIVVPHFAGSATPDMNEAFSGSILGLRFDTDSSVIYRALIEGVSYEMKYNLEILEKHGITFTEIRAVGGGAKSDYWLQIKSNIFGKTIVSLDVEEAGIVGAAILAGTATGVFQDISAALKVFIKKRKSFLPDKTEMAFYEKQYEKYKRIRKGIGEL